jgi:hypothetical protein
MENDAVVAQASLVARGDERDLAAGDRRLC